VTAAPSGGARVEARHWCHRYPGRSQPALAEVTFSIAAGELVLLIGGSGSGKSTLLAALAGVLPPGPDDAGLLRATSGSGQSARVGLVQQEPEGNIVMERVGDDVAFPLESAGVPSELIPDRVRQALAAVGLDVALDRPTAALSGGQQQLLALAAAAVAGPDLLLLDEPTANLDPCSADRVVRAVDALRAATGCTVVVVEHRVQPWWARADAVLLAQAGSIQRIARDAVGQRLGARPELGGRVWLERLRLPRVPPREPPGAMVLAARGVAVEGRLAAVDLDVRSGEIVALTGPPGSGKTTLLECLAGLRTPSSGSVQVAGRASPWAWPAREVAATFGVVFQDPEHQFLTGRAVDELRHGLAGAGVPADVAVLRARQMLDRLDLGARAEDDPFTLSGGEQRRLSVATALVLDPRVLLLDEPTFGQDPTTWSGLVAILASHRDAGGAIVLATHDPRLVEALGARQVALAAPPPPIPPGPRTRSTPGLPPGRGLRGLDPVALLGAAILASTAALISVAVPLTLLLAALVLATAALGGLSGRRLALLAAPALLAAASVALSNALLSPAGPASPEAWAAAALPACRVLAVALPGLVAAVALDPTALADALVVRLAVPARPAYAVLAALRLLPLLAEEWRTLGRASRARGVGGSGPRRSVAVFVSMTFRLLVAALRRGQRLATALDVRGLRSDSSRTLARPVRWRPADTALLLGAAALVVAAVGTRLPT